MKWTPERESTPTWRTKQHVSDLSQRVRQMTAAQHLFTETLNVSQS